MSLEYLHVVTAGLLTTVQDLGRWGFQACGVPVAGPMDPSAHRVANALVGNAAGAATLEVTMSGPELIFDGPRRVAVSGAEFDLTVDGATVQMNQAVEMPPGGSLRFGVRRRGARAYLAVAGGIDVPAVLGSRATDVGSGIGGLGGRAVTAGDRLPLGTHTPQVAAPTPSLEPDDVSAIVVLPETSVRVRILAGPRHDAFLPAALETLCANEYVVGSESNRMGYRLGGPPLRHRAGADVISEATVRGAIQVPGSGAPVLLMADRQTTGGYAQIASVISADFGIAGQLAPGDVVAFSTCTPRDALGALVARERVLMRLEAGVAG